MTAVGDRLPRREFGPITITDIVRYQGASGDFNPIHHDEAFARSSGAPTVFSVGMLQAGFLAAYLADLFDPQNVRGIRVRFGDRVWPGDTLVCHGEVGAWERIEGHGGDAVFQALVVIRAERSSGEVVASGEATVWSHEPALPQ